MESKGLRYLQAGREAANMEFTDRASDVSHNVTNTQGSPRVASIAGSVVSRIIYIPVGTLNLLSGDKTETRGILELKKKSFPD